MKKLSTKEKILLTAHRLFSENGFTGVSIRELSTECDCNIASINYHFKNKENLYHETIKSSIEKTEREIKAIYEGLAEKSTVSFSIEIFNFFISRSEDLRTAFKLITDAPKFSEQIHACTNSGHGPPGAEFMVLCLRADAPNASDEDIQWATRCLFSNIFHKSLIGSSQGMLSCIENSFGVNIFQEDIKRLVNLVVKDITK